ncbi:uncharacterized protein [Oscarella lobularis]|uniref:uncharacterized protein n=1 Tax=Oscarella lobularis TaxID=121494 RepID=UPI003313177A
MTPLVLPILLLLVGSTTTTKTTKTSRERSKAVRAMEMVHQKSIEGAAGNCTVGAVDTVELIYDVKRWEPTARVAVFVANFVTLQLPLAKNAVGAARRPNGTISISSSLSDDFDSSFGPLDDVWLYEIVANTVRTQTSIMGSGVCFGEYEYKDYKNFCPYAFESHNDSTFVAMKDLSVPDYAYTDLNASQAEWWDGPRRKLAGKTDWELWTFMTGDVNGNVITTKDPVVKLTDGYWTKPYYDCGGAYRWMITFLAPFLARDPRRGNNYTYIGVTSVDIDLSNIDINQCDPTPTTTNVSYSDDGDVLTDQFLGSHHCQSETTDCRFIAGRGFKRGSYVCTCKRGWYLLLDDTPSIVVVDDGTIGFDGEDVEREGDRLARGEPSRLLDPTAFQCRKCSSGCDECVDASPCLYSPGSQPVAVATTLAAVTIIVAVLASIFTVKHRHREVVAVFGDLLLYFLLLGTILRAFHVLIGYFDASPLTCVVRPWLYHVGLTLTTVCLTLSLYRINRFTQINPIFAKNVTRRLTNPRLVRWLGLSLLCIAAILILWTGMDRPLTEKRFLTRTLRYIGCRMSPWLVPFYSFHFAMLAVAAYQAYRIRFVQLGFSENKSLPAAVCVHFLFTIFSPIWPIVSKATKFDPASAYCIESLLIFIDDMTTIVLLFAAKVYASLKKKAGRVVRARRRSSTQCISVVALRDLWVGVDHDSMDYVQKATKKSFAYDDDDDDDDDERKPRPMTLYHLEQALYRDYKEALSRRCRKCCLPVLEPLEEEDDWTIGSDGEESAIDSERRLSLGSRRGSGLSAKSGRRRSSTSSTLSGRRRKASVVTFVMDDGNGQRRRSSSSSASSGPKKSCLKDTRRSSSVSHDSCAFNDEEGNQENRRRSSGAAVRLPVVLIEQHCSGVSEGSDERSNSIDVIRLEDSGFLSVAGAGQGHRSLRHMREEPLSRSCGSVANASAELSIVDIGYYNSSMERLLSSSCGSIADDELPKKPKETSLSEPEHKVRKSSKETTV